MKTSLAILIAVVAAVSGQRVDPRNAAILAEARYLSGDGSFGAAYVTEDQSEFKEETQANGDRKGQYSYIDPTGKKITVQYTAGKNGFQVSGDHLPKAPAPLPAAAPAPQYSAQPQYNAIPQQNYQQQQYPQPQQQQYNQLGNDEDGQYNPAIHEHPYQYREDNQQNYQQSAPAAPRPQPQQNFNQGFNYQHQAAGFNQQQQQQQPQQYQPTTQAPQRFFPPGQLDLNRTPQGYNFQFQSSRQ